MRGARLASAPVLAAVLVSGKALAQTPPPAPTPPIARVKAPEVLSAADPACVPDATGQGVVKLDVVVERTGEIGTIDVVDGQAPWIESALAAARAHRFAPAERNGAPVSARIRLEATVPACRLPAPAAPAADVAPKVAPTEPAPAKPRPGDDLVDVHGRRETYTPTERTIGRMDIKSVPGAFGDPFRAIDILPGVVPTISGLPFYYIRGAPPSTVGYFVDEVRVPYLFHFALGPGVIQPALVDEVSVHPASFPGRFGRFSGAIVEGRTKDAPTDRKSVV